MATLDVLTAAEALAAVNGVSATDAAELATYTTALSLALDGWCGPIVERTITGERVNGGHTDMYLRHWPISAVASISDYGTACTEETDATAPPAEGYILTPHGTQAGLYGPEIVRRSEGIDYVWYRGRGTVVVTYTAGRFASTATVDERFKAAARIMLQNAWRSEQHSVSQFDEYTVPHQSFPKFAFPNAARHLLSGEIQNDPERSVVVT